MSEEEDYNPLAILDAFVPILECLRGLVATMVNDGFPEDLSREFVLRMWINGQKDDAEETGQPPAG